MNKEIIIGAVVIGGACAFVGASIIGRMNSEFRGVARKAFDDMVKAKYKEEDNKLQEALEVAKEKASKIFADENAKIKAEATSNSEYIKARTNADVLKAEIDVLKKAINQMKADTTQVAVGSGDNAVAVNIENNSKIIEAKSKLASKEFEYKYNNSLADQLYSAAAKSVKASRTEEQSAIIREYEKAKLDTIVLTSKKEEYRNELRNDSDICLRISKQALKESYSVSKIVVSHALLAVFPASVVALVIWHMIANLRMLKTVKEG